MRQFNIVVMLIAVLAVGAWAGYQRSETGDDILTSHMIRAGLTDAQIEELLGLPRLDAEGVQVGPLLWHSPDYMVAAVVDFYTGSEGSELCCNQTVIYDDRRIKG